METVILSSKTSPGRVLNLRPSQMPFCPLEFFINYSNKGLYRAQDLMSAFYTSVGTTVHEVMQNYLCRSGRFLANYSCRECGKKYPLSYQHECCDFPTKYDELEIDYKGVEGHIDAVFKDRKGKLWIVDFKTTSVKSGPAKKRDPGVAYREQIETYAVLFELQYRLAIEGIMDSFILRDNPKSSPIPWFRPVTDLMRSKVKKRLVRYKKMHKAALHATTKQEALDLLDFGRCTNPYCKVCVFDDKKLKLSLVLAFNRGTRAQRLPIYDLAKTALNK